VPIGDPALRACHRQVFLAPPWPGINDSERRHTFAAAAAEHDRLATAYTDLGYTLTELPRTSVADRAELMLAPLADDLPLGSTLRDLDSRCWMVRVPARIAI
jgi:hypothetical protein